MEVWECTICEITFHVEKGATYCPYCGLMTVEFVESFLIDWEGQP